MDIGEMDGTLESINHTLDCIRARLVNYNGYLYMGNLYMGSSLPEPSDLFVRLDPIYSDWVFDGPVIFEMPGGGRPAHLVIPFKPIR